MPARIVSVVAVPRVAETCRYQNPSCPPIGVSESPK